MFERKPRVATVLVCPACKVPLRVHADGAVDEAESFFFSSDEDTCVCGADLIWLRDLCGCNAVVIGGEEHICPGTIPLYGTDEYERLDPRTLAKYEACKPYGKLEDRQAFRWPDGDAIVDRWFAILRFGDVIHLVSSSTGTSLVDAMRAIGVDPKPYRAPTRLSAKTERIAWS